MFFADCRAQSSIELPKSFPRLPAGENNQSEFLISKANAKVFKDYLPEGIANWLNKGEVVFKAYRSLGFSWIISRQWEEQSEKNPQIYALDENLNFGETKQSNNLYGLPFGLASQIDSENDLAIKAQKILWNIYFAQAVSRELYQEFELSWVGKQGLVRRAQGLVFRAVSNPLADEASDSKKNIQKSVSEEESNYQLSKGLMFGENVKFFSPDIVADYSLFRNRYYQQKEDKVWIYSPVLKKTREVFSTNESDGIIGSSVALTDFFVWSGKPTEFKAKVIAEKVLFLPFPSLGPSVATSENFDVSREATLAGVPDGSPLGPKKEPGNNQALTVRGEFLRSDGRNASVLWNYQARRFPESASWLPVSAGFVPRNVWIIELENQDRYSPWGKQVLVVDKESMLPFYKFIYDQKGILRKTVIGSWGFAYDKASNEGFPYLAFLVSRETSKGFVNNLSSLLVRRIDGMKSKTAEKLRADLNPPKLEKSKAEKAGKDLPKESVKEDGGGSTD